MKNEILTIKEFEDNFSEKNILWGGKNSSKRKGGKIFIKNHQMWALSQRYKLFLEKGYTCVCCGKKGTHFSIDSTDGTNLKHLNLRAEDGTLITKDHIIPKSKGGKDIMSNYQVMCEKCNLKKGNKLK